MDRQKQNWKRKQERQGRPHVKPLIPFLAALVVAAVLLTLGLTQFTQAGYLAQSGFAVSGDELGRLLKSGETGNVCLASVDMGDALFVRSLSRNTYYVGDEKTEINAGYPVFAREGQLLYFLDDSLSMVTENWEVLGTYEGLYLSEGTTFNADRQQADIDRVLLVKVDGGYLLARQPEDISLRDIIVAMEGTTRINRCLEPDGYCSRNGVPNCPVHKFYSRIQTKLDEAFQEMTVAALLADDLDEK